MASIHVPYTREHRALQGGIGGHESWARTSDRSARTANGRARFLRRFDDQVDPERLLPAAERERRAKSARSAYFARLALRSSRNRAKAAAARGAAVDFERAAEATDAELASALDAAAEGGAA
jgi:hypothetical protein